MNKISFQNDETASVQGKRFQEANQRIDGAIISLAPRISNRDTANLIAKLARAGHMVHKGKEHDFTVVQIHWGMSRYCRDLAELNSFARQVGAPQ